MGFTRYWNRTSKPIGHEFTLKVDEILEECELLGIGISFRITDSFIRLNGNADLDLDHEDFFLNNGETGFDFCKTARKPYDYAVRKILAEAEKEGLVTNVSSDGENEEIISDDEYLHGKS